nr:unnamed protein product [Spirometra erinaceieuropaei]
MSRRRYHEAFFDDDETFSSKRGRPDRDTVESLLYRIGSKDTEKIQRDISELSLLVVELLFRELKDALKSCRFDDAKYLVRFLSYAVCSNVVHPGSLLALYENFAEVTLDVCVSSQARTDWYSYVVLYALPYSAQLLADHDASALNAVLSTISVYLSKRRTLHVRMLRVWDSDDPHPQEDYLSCLWAQISSMRSAGWKEHVLSKISDAFPALRESGQSCKFSQITPPDYDPEIVYPLPQVVFRMFDYTDVYSAEDEDMEQDNQTTGTKTENSGATLPGAHTIERFLIDEQLHIILETMNFNRVLCARALLGLQTRARVALDYMIVEAIFADIFRLPKPPVRHGNLLFYASLLIQLCNEASNTMPLVLAQAAETLFDRLDTMKPVCAARFVEWFSFHLTNYQLQWSWQDWSRALSEPLMSPRRWLISETLRRLIRYSYHENVKQRLPRPFHPLLPPEPTPVNPYADASPRKLKAFNRVFEAFCDRRSPESLLDLIKRLTSRDGQDGSGEESDPDEDSDAHSSRRSSSRHSSRSSSASDTEKDEKKERLKRRPHIIASRRNPAGGRRSEARDSGREDENAEVDGAADEAGSVTVDPLLRSGASVGRNASPPRLDDAGFVAAPGTAMLAAGTDATAGGTTGAGGGASHQLCVVPGVTSRPLELFMTALLYRAHKTISHTCSLLKRYSETFRCLASTVESQVEALHILQAVWVNQSQMVVVISDYMCRNGLLDPEAIVRWAFSPHMTAFKGPLSPSTDFYVKPRILELHVWECLLHTLVRVGRRVAQINPKLEAAKESLEIQRHKSDSDSSESEDEEDRGGRSKSISLRRDRDTGGHRRVRSRSSDESADGHERDSRRSVAVADKVTRLEEERCEAVRSQCAVITLLLHRHVRLIDSVEEAAEEAAANSAAGESEAAGEMSREELGFVSYWLKGRLMQTVLEHQDQLLPYMENLEALMSDVCPFVQEVFQSLRSLYA